MREPKSVLQSWLLDLTLQQQGVLLTAIRGPDGMPKRCPAKDLVAALRGAVLNGAYPEQRGGFMGDHSGIPPGESIAAFFKDHDQYPHHWFMHFLHAAQVIGVCHPDSRVAGVWLGIYMRLCESMHVEAETADDMHNRLCGDGIGDGSGGF